MWSKQLETPQSLLHRLLQMNQEPNPNLKETKQNKTKQEKKNKKERKKEKKMSLDYKPSSILCMCNTVPISVPNLKLGPEYGTLNLANCKTKRAGTCPMLILNIFNSQH